MKITLSGTAGSGKSTIARMLSKKLKYKHYSMGDFQREIAKELGVSIIELGELEKKDPAIDKMVDEKQRMIGETEDNFVIDSWLSSHFIPDSFKIFLDGEIRERAIRVMGREPGMYKDIEDAVEKIRLRENTNHVRWKRFYRFDFKDRKNFDLVVDTTGKSIKQVFMEIYVKINSDII